MRFDFGRYRGEEVREVPASYLVWCLRECQCLSPWLREAIEAELIRRGDGARRRAQPRQEQPPGTLSPAELSSRVTTWFRQLVMRYHPDRGGSNDAMAALNDANERLKDILGL